MTTDQRIVFLDTETTSLRPDRQAWEVGLIVREPGEPDVEHSWFVQIADLQLREADLISLKIGGFYERHPAMKNRGTPGEALKTLKTGHVIAPEYTVMSNIEDLTRGAIIVGAVPNFDTETLAQTMRSYGYLPAWHYHLVDVETLAAGFLGLQPLWDFDAVLGEFGLSYAEAERHTALGDARMARDLYDRIMGDPRRGANPS